VVQNQFRLRGGVELGGDWTLDALVFAWNTEQDLTDTRTFLENAAGQPVGQGRVQFNGAVWNATGLNFSKFGRSEYLAGVKLAGTAGGWETRFNLSRYWIPEWETRSSSNYNTGVSNGGGNQQVQDHPGWWALDAGIEQEFGAHTIALGLNANGYETAQETFSVSAWRDAATPAFSSATRGQTTQWGLYAEDAIDLAGSATLTVGLRYDRWRADDGAISRQSAAMRLDDLYPEREDDSLSPKISIQSQLTDALGVQVSVGSAVRFPTVGELFHGQIDIATQQIDPQSFDPKLRPERSQDVNLIVRKTFGDARVTGSVFYQDIEDAIFSFQGLNQFGNVRSGYKNVDQVRQYGVEIIGEFSELLVPGLDLEGSVTWMDARTVRNTPDPAAEGVMFPRIPEWRLNGNLRYTFTDAINGSVGWRYATRPNSDLLGLQRGDAFGFQSEYFLVDARLNWNAADKLRLSAGIDNINNDQAYVAHPLPQRTFILEVRWRQ